MTKEEKIEHIAVLLHNCGLSALQCPNSKDYDSWYCYRLKIARELSDYMIVVDQREGK